jgi:hypothetical protein
VQERVDFVRRFRGLNCRLREITGNRRLAHRRRRAGSAQPGTAVFQRIDFYEFFIPLRIR